MLWGDKGVLRMEAKVRKWPRYRHSNTLKTLTSGSEMNDAFSWMRSCMVSLCGCFATNIKPTKNGITRSRKGEMLLRNFFIFLYVSGLANHIKFLLHTTNKPNIDWLGKSFRPTAGFSRPTGFGRLSAQMGRWPMEAGCLSISADDMRC